MRLGELYSLDWSWAGQVAEGHRPIPNDPERVQFLLDRLWPNLARRPFSCERSSVYRCISAVVSD